MTAFRTDVASILLSASLMVVTACSSGGGGGNPGGDDSNNNNDLPSYLVQSTAGVGGSISPESVTVSAGASTHFTVTPDTGYQISSITGCDGSLSGNTYTTGTISGDCQISVSFSGQTSVQTFSISATAGQGGSISPTSITVDQGESRMFTITPDAGYQISSVTGCDGTLSGNTYTTGTISGDCQISVSFSVQTSVQTFSIGATAGQGGSITPAAQVINYGATARFVVLANAGYEINSVIGCNGALMGTTFTTDTITSDCSVNASFSPLSFTVQTRVGTGGSVTPATQPVTYGATASVTITPSLGYDLTSVSGCGGELTDNTYTTAQIFNDCTIDIVFTEQQFTVNAVTSGGGSITPMAQSVGYGANAVFTITPDEGYGIASISGCDGSLINDIYTTGAITAACTVVVDFMPIISPVSALYPVNGANWNDYVRGADRVTATDVACNAAVDQACVHAGEIRVVHTILTSCDGITASDALGVFDWECDDSTGRVRIISKGFAQGIEIYDLLNFTTPSWLANSVSIYVDGILWRETAPASWWGNPMTYAGDGSIALDVESALYLVGENTTLANSYTISASKVALVADEGVVITSPGIGVHVITAENLNYLWITGTLDASVDVAGIALTNVKFSRLSNVNVSNSTYYGIYMRTLSDFNVLSHVSVTNSEHGIAIIGSSNNTVSGMTIKNNNTNGLYMGSSTDNSFSEIEISNNGRGMYFQYYVDRNNFSNVKIMKCAFGSAISLNRSSNNVFSGLNMSNCLAANISLHSESNNNIFSSVTTTSSGHGIIVYESSHNAFLGITTVNNNSGVTIGGISAPSNYNTFQGLVAANNIIGIGSGYEYNSLASVTAADNLIYGIQHGGNYNVFYELLKVGNNGTDCYVGSGTDPGLDDDNNPDDVSTIGSDNVHDGLCIAQGNSDFGVAVTGVTLLDSFVGKVATNDAANDSDTNGMANYPLDPHSFDWITFDNDFRSWGKDGSTYPNLDQQEQWETGQGRIWDWSLRYFDTVLRDVIDVPTSNRTLTHIWDGVPSTNNDAGCDAMIAGSKWNPLNSVCTSVLLRNAIEIFGDEIGNDNGLCESNETCLYTPNIGSYQGHGTLIPAGTIGMGGSIENVTLVQYEINGYQ
ncbi:MAG: hypothetical protein AMJ53_00655 [Gammaproteobacteria bacterium SG8_11]|nr:MAG: hypothetical protein AMJ53_00655 [Gammaproteobacteria bacterium SG8_11]